MTLMKIEIAHPNTESFDKIILCLLDTIDFFLRFWLSIMMVDKKWAQISEMGTP